MKPRRVASVLVRWNPPHLHTIVLGQATAYQDRSEPLCITFFPSPVHRRTRPLLQDSLMKFELYSKETHYHGGSRCGGAEICAGARNRFWNSLRNFSQSVKPRIRISVICPFLAFCHRATFAYYNIDIPFLIFCLRAGSKGES